ncbi:MAG: hypothetical protein JW955_11305 [Sedimentisphaerales bacterium]|nr:hypothetical protein [Sedimentisphaerales bacterium]
MNCGTRIAGQRETAAPSSARMGVSFLITVALLPCVTCAETAFVFISGSGDAAPRAEYGAARLIDALTKAGYEQPVARPPLTTKEQRIVVGNTQDPAIRELIAKGQLRLEASEPGREGFVLATCGNGVTAVVGGDDSGTLYGCLELAQRVRRSGKLPAELRFADKPAFMLRGPCIGMQKTSILPGRKTYEYPYTPELFPWFYDKQLWDEYLDFLARHRMNTLYLWNGHPFASLVKLADYPYAVEVPEDVFARNVEMFRYITRECDKRGIWLVQMFYNVLLPKPFAERHGVSTQLAAGTPLAADYTRKSIAEFVKQYPHVGLMVCLGEALRGVENQQAWLIDTILPGIQDGMKGAGLRDEPPVVIRTHATDLETIMPAALRVYRNLYTEAKYNGESLTTWEPRGEWQRRHLAMSRLGSTHVANVHILANLEPFRYGAQRFIRKSVLASRDRLGAKGLHLYPLFYWDWPISPDKTTVPLKQWERDWIWFEAWARYAWNPDIDEADDRAYWISRFTERYGNERAAAKILDAYNDAGECAPRLLRRFGITEGNRQTLSLGMTLDQLVNAGRYGPYDELWKSQSPPGERLEEFAGREWNKQPHEGETPPQIIQEALHFSRRAVEAIEAAAPLVTENDDEFERLRNDVHCIHAMSQFYAAKVHAAMCVLRHNFSHDVADMEQAQKHMVESLVHFKKLASLTEHTYRFANSLQTSHRKIPFVGAVNGVPTNYHWTQLVPLYEKELEDFRAHVASLREKNEAPDSML